jgi:hypothetical protein
VDGWKDEEGLVSQSHGMRKGVGALSGLIDTVPGTKLYFTYFINLWVEVKQRHISCKLKR